MFYGKWNASVDHKWRMNVPREILKDLGQKVLLYESNEVIRIEVFKGVTEKLELIHLCKVKSGKILIPEHLRNSESFYFGKKISIVGKGGFLEIWPRK